MTVWRSHPQGCIYTYTSDRVNRQLWACALHNLGQTQTSASKEIATRSNELRHGRPRQKSRTQTRISVNTKHWFTWARFLSLAQSKLRLCSANHRPGYWSNLTCDWLSTAWAYSEQETENGPCFDCVRAGTQMLRLRYWMSYKCSLSPCCSHINEIKQWTLSKHEGSRWKTLLWYTFQNNNFQNHYTDEQLKHFMWPLLQGEWYQTPLMMSQHWLR